MNIAVAQSGGPTCAINASLLGVCRQAMKSPEIDVVYGSVNGIEGVINDNLVDMGSLLKTEEDMEILNFLETKRPFSSYVKSLILKDMNENK